MKSRLILIFCAAQTLAPAQLTSDQRVSDFRHLADLYARRYAPLEWKRDLLKFDALNLAPWTQRISNLRNDLEFYDLMIEYVAAFNDAHVGYSLPASFIATMGFTADIYDGKVLIDSINRDRLPKEEFAFEIGDELVSIDGRTADELIKAFERYGVAANPRSTRRYTAASLTVRDQSVMPGAAQIGETAAVVVRRENGESLSLTIPWRKEGIPVSVLGPSPGPRTAATESAALADPEQEQERIGPKLGKLSWRTNYAVTRRPALVGFGRLAPIFDMPDGFIQRMGRNRFDPYYSGTFEAEGLKIGFIRIPDFGFRSTRDFEREIAYFKENTDGLIVDVMRNPGGSPCTAETLMARLSTNDFEVIQAEDRVTWSDLFDVKSALEFAREDEDTTSIELLELLEKEYQLAFESNRGRTRPLPICGAKSVLSGRVDAYEKPLMLLVDEFTTSAADMFAAMFQDNRRGILFGMRTLGAGGGVQFDIPVGAYTEGFTAITRSIAVRKQPIATSDYPTTAYIENVGVRPEKQSDYMTRENLLDKGKPFVQAFTSAIVEHIKAGR